MLEHRLRGASALMIVGWKGKAEEEAAYTADYPLHDQIGRNAIAAIQDIIRKAYTENSALIRQQDLNGFTPLHRAAEFHNVVAIKTLLELGVQEDLHRRDNADLEMPAMLCEHELGVMREVQEIKQDRWSGYMAVRMSRVRV